MSTCPGKIVIAFKLGDSPALWPSLIPRTVNGHALVGTLNGKDDEGVS